jgi:glycine/D-amino acid oxidase-like deaminating enzyme
MKKRSAEIVICGAGIAGVSAAYFLAVKHGLKDILLIDERPPLTLTSDKSTECYRNWWPGPGDAMVQLMNRSIDLMEDMAVDSGNLFHLNRRGYLYVTTDPARLSALEKSAAEASDLGAGELRLHTTGDQSYQPHKAEGFVDSPLGADLITDQALIQKHFPYLSRDVQAALHVRRAGWLSAQQYGIWLLERAREAGVEFIQGRVSDVEVSAGAVSGLTLSDGSQISTSSFVNAAGPYLANIGQMIGVDIPVINEAHLKAGINDHLAVLDRDAPMVIHADEQRIDWTNEESAILAEDPETAWLLEPLPFGAHTRPEGDLRAQSILVLWDTHNEAVDAKFPLPIDPMVAELALRGLSSIIPGMTKYLDKMPKPFIDGGYYTKTQENRPLAGPLEVGGAYLIGAASGYGIMAAAALAELLAAHIVSDKLSGYAAAFSLDRYQNPEYKRLLENWGDSWQL